MKKKPSPKNDLLINGTSGDDLLVGTADADTINGLDGNDTLIGEGGSDILIGGTGDDVFRAETSADHILENVGEGYDRVYANGNYALDAGSEIELLAYIDPNQTMNVNLTGNEFAQTIVGGAGRNIIVGGGGADTMAGNDGDDTYRVQDAGDIVLESGGGGFDSVIVDISLGSYTLPADIVVERLSVFDDFNPAAFDLTGNEFENFITGSVGVNTLIGGGGEDVLAGGEGGDFYRIDDFGDDILESALTGGIDSVYVAMNLSGYVLANDVGIEALGAIDPMLTIVFDLTGNALANTIFGSAGQNTLIGGGGNDTLIGFAGNDFYRVEETGDRVVESAGNGFDYVYAGLSYTLAAGSEIEVLATLEPALTDPLSLTGNELANEIYGNDGANVIDGKVGDDLLFGFAGADIFAFTNTADSGNVDTIGDFLAGTDKIGLDDSTFAGVGTPGAFNANCFVIGTAAGDSDDRILYDQATGRLLYDLDGSGAGTAYHFTTLAGAPVLAASDFTVI